MAELIVLPANASREQVLEVVARDGGVIVRDLLRQDTVNQFKSDIEVAAREHPTGATTGNERTVEFW